ncbi:MAG: hypothetical protein Q9M91_02060 [Candidatus Dojkabacteria bacterium]|nr:hypothetical protein [Candidatus Dojkabacteria bacterium]MDQ7020608.1 hypothetical protein [Candidatus Dojkabacteria bacterium]
MAEKNYIFNLLKPIEQPLTSWDRVYEWLIGRAKIIIMVTQAVIAITFFAKVALDTIAKSKDDQIEELNNQIILYTTEREPRYRLIQNKEVNYRNMWSSSRKVAPVLRELYSYIPNIGTDVVISIIGNIVSISTDDSRANLDSLETAIKSSATFSSAGASVSIEGEDIINGTGKGAFNAIIDEAVLLRGKF